MAQLQRYVEVGVQDGLIGRAAIERVDQIEQVLLFSAVLLV